MQTPPPSDNEVEATRPPVQTLRYHFPTELFSAIPQAAQLIHRPPEEREESLAYLRRLAGSTTPEDAVTYTAFAALPMVAIWWAYECVRTSQASFTPGEREILEMVAAWATYPTDANRYRTMQAALYAPVKGPALYLGLAVGWSGGAYAPNDPAPVAPHRTPRAVNSAVLSCLARSDLSQRNSLLARFIRLSQPLHGPS